MGYGEEYFEFGGAEDGVGGCGCECGWGGGVGLFVGRGEAGGWKGSGGLEEGLEGVYIRRLKSGVCFTKFYNGRVVLSTIFLSSMGVSTTTNAAECTATVSS